MFNFITFTGEINQVPTNSTVQENFPGEKGLITDYADAFLSSERLAKAHAESGSRLFIHPIDSEDALYYHDQDAVFFEHQYQEDSLFLPGLVSRTEQVYNQRPEEVLVYMTYKFGSEKDARAHYLVSTTSAELAESCLFEILSHLQMLAEADEENTAAYKKIYEEYESLGEPLFS